MDQIDAIASLVERKAKELASPIKSEMLGGVCPDIERYRFLSGYLQGLDNLVTDIFDALKIMEEKDD